jgi:glycosyltransferase involved in cell wall biosynthesis
MRGALTILGTRGVPSRFGGFETLAEQLQSRLAIKEISVQVFSSIKQRSASTSPTRVKYLETLIGTWQSARDVSIEFSGAMLVVNPVNVVTALRLRRRGYRVAIHMDGRDDMRSKWPILIRMLYRWCQHLCVWSRIPLVFDSFAVRKEIGGRHPERHLVITYGGCEACETSRSVWLDSGGQRHFLVLARAEPENQITEAVRAVRAMLTQSRLSVVTTSRYQGKYWHSLVREVGRTNAAQLIDGVWDKEQLCSIYREVSAVIHGHSVGGTNPSLVLALCHGTPVLAHDNPYNREVAGSMARYWKDEAELTKLLDEFDPMTWPYDQDAVDDVNRRYNWDDVVEKYRQLLGL